ncbi:MAG TPA: hypothetical protein VMZ04_00290 [Anaerolineae bacterium]|nr:hypothetical protein [Anaerolineae bacterium]
MENIETVITQIIDLDKHAEEIRMKAYEKASKMKEEALQKREIMRNETEHLIEEKVAKIDEHATKERNEKTGKVRREFSEQTESIKNIPPEKMRKSVNIVVSRIKGMAG